MKRPFLILLPAWLALAVTSGCGKVLLTTDDVVVMPGQPALFVAQLERETLFGRDGLENEAVTFYLDGTRIGEARTDDEGRAHLVAEWGDAPVPGTVAATASVWGRTTRVVAAARAWRPDRVIIAVDIDHTLADTDYARLLLAEADTKSEPLPGSVEGLRRLDEHFHVYYLTARPRFLLDKTRQWLVRHGYPDAPLATARTVSDLADPGSVKRAMLGRRRAHLPNLLIGIGDKESDLAAYVATGMLSVILGDADLPPDMPNVVLMADWSALNEYFERNAAELRDAERLNARLRRGAESKRTPPRPMPARAHEAVADANDR